MKIIAIFGSRRRNSIKDYTLLRRKFLLLYEDGDRIVSGGCKEGGDSFAEILAKLYEVPIMIHYARWKKYTKPTGINPAGFIRNTDIANDATIGIALPAKNRKGGTEDTIKKMKKLGKKVYLI